MTPPLTTTTTAPQAHWADVLVDVMLALLARPAAPLPAAPLREAVEASFRSTCAELSAAGLQDLVRVVGRSEEAGPGGWPGAEACGCDGVVAAVKGSCVWSDSLLL